MQPGLYQRDTTGQLRVWKRTHVRELLGFGPAADKQRNLGEEYLEELIAADPEVLGLTADDNRSPIHGPFVCLRQVELPRYSGGNIYPDVLVFCGSGDVIVVEVKLADNPELRGRSVVGQVLEYAACLSGLDDDALVAMLKKAHAKNPLSANTWEDVVEEMFQRKAAEQAATAAPPVDYRRLANQLRARLLDSELHLVIAADGIPPGLEELVQSVVSQKALGTYKLQVSEIVPYVLDSSPGVVMFVPETRIETAILGRTAVTVAYEVGQAKPGVDVKTTSIDEINSEARRARERSVGRQWDEATFFDVLSTLGPLAAAGVRHVLDVLQERHYQIRYGRGAKIGTMNIVFPGPEETDAFSFQTNGVLLIVFSKLPDDAALKARRGLSWMGLKASDKKWMELGLEAWLPKVDEILSLMKDLEAEVS